MNSNQLDLRTVEVSGESIRAIIGGFPDYLSDIATTFLLMNGIQEPESGSWVPIDKVLKVLDAISKKFGDSTVYEIGKSIPEKAILPENVKDFKMALQKFCDGFSLNHRNIKISCLEIIELNYSGRKAIVQISNPYPFELNRGIIACLARKFEPQNAVKLPEVSFQENSCIVISEFEKQCKITITW